MKRPIRLAAAMVFVVAACSSDPTAGVRSDTDPSSSSSGTGGSEQSAAGDRFSCEAVSGGGAEGEPVDQVASTEREAVVSALEQRTDDSFPAPLVDIDAIRSGGPPPDGIPPIDSPRFVTADAVDYLADCEVVLALEVDGVARAYPVQIMTWHEIVNDTVNGVPVTVSYCPLCNSALAYDRRLGDRILDFGTSGSLYNSSLIMYDRQTESLWTHFTGQAVVGHLTGEQLDLLPIQTISFGAFRDRHPEGLVLTQATGFQRNYGANPYVSYDVAGGGNAFLFDGDVPEPYNDTARVIGIDHNGAKIAVLHDLAFANRVVPVDAGGDPVVVFVDPGASSPLEQGLVTSGRDVGSSGVFQSELDGQPLTFTWTEDGFIDDQTGSVWSVTGEAISGEFAGQRLEPVIHLDTFWFSWNAFHPDTEVVS